MTDAERGSRRTALRGSVALQYGDHSVQNNYFTLVFPDPVEVGAQRLGRVVLGQWRQEAALRGLLGTRPIPVRWRVASGAEAGDHPGPDGDQGDDEGGGSTADLTAFADAFSDSERRRLVVLGGAGSGKTSLAVLLVIELLQRMDEGDPVPVLLSLASWRPGEEHFARWLERQLLREYPYLDLDTVRVLLRDQRVLPVLDGLDELPVPERPEALEALNTALAEGGPLILTSRTEDYEAAAGSASVLQEAAVVRAEPLTVEEAVRYLLASAAPQHRERWRPLTDAIGEDPSCPAAEVLRVPLMLWLCRTAYRRPIAGRLPGDLADRSLFPTAVAIEDHLLDSLLPAVYPAGPLPPPQPGRRVSREAPWQGRQRDPERVARWLGFLARHLRQRGTADLAWWELGTAVRLVPRMIVTGLVCALCLGVVIGPLDGVAAALGHTGPDPGLWPGLVQGVLLGAADVLINGVPAAVAFALVHGTGVLLRGAAPEPSRVRIRLGGRAGRSRARSGPEILARAGLGIAGGLAGGFGIGLVQGLVRKLLTGDPLALRVGLVDGVILGGPAGTVAVPHVAVGQAQGVEAVPGVLVRPAGRRKPVCGRRRPLLLFRRPCERKRRWYP
ncbi:NACHT domain-containing protein [Kitasatospora indigofera]|uniref:NACHT domain-containing protein n=1 Tax=Kitasatospora indigofera TaxID=67307 RepID=UPI00369229AD